MPGPRSTPVTSELFLPKSVDVVVIGGGIVGVASALELAERSVSVPLFEKGQIAGERSSRNWGWVRLGMRDPREIPLRQESIGIWRSLDNRTGRKTGYVQSGILFGASDRRSLINLYWWLESLGGQKTGAQMTTQAGSRSGGRSVDAARPAFRTPMGGAGDRSSGS